MLRHPLHALRNILVQQRILPAEQPLDARTQRRPPLAWQREMATQVQQRDLPHRVADTAALHQAVGDVTLTGSGVAVLSSAHEHAQDRSMKNSERIARPKRLWHYIWRQHDRQRKIN
jgi:hypothetical protein